MKLDQAEVKQVAQTEQPKTGGWYQRPDGSYVVMFPNADRNFRAANAAIDAEIARIQRKRAGR